MLLKEACVENFTDIPAALRAGANRIELNDNLTAGGTTVSRGVMAAAISYVHEHDARIVCMIRPRGGNFVYTDTELKIMETDLFAAQELGADGVAFGALTKANWLDEDAMENLIGAAGGMEVVMHMAFDEIPKARQQEAIDWLSDHDVTRILTHGGPLSVPITQTVPHLQQLVKMAAGKLEILPGGGVTAANVDELTAAIGVKQAHGTKVVTFK